MSPAIDTLLVADWAEAVNGKLYLMGGGFTALMVNDETLPCRFAVAAILTVPAGHEGAVPLHAWLEDGQGQRLGDWELGDRLTVPKRLEQPSSFVIAGPVEVKSSADSEVVVRMTFADAQRSVSFRTVRPSGQG
jgi:hypothetical protein